MGSRIAKSAKKILSAQRNSLLNRYHDKMFKTDQSVEGEPRAAVERPVKTTVKAPTKTRSKSVAVSPKETPTRPAVRVLTEDIAQKAYGYFVARGYHHGYDVEDWLRAEDELRQT